MRRIAIGICAVLAAACNTGPLAGAERDSDNELSRLNILLIYADDLGWRDSGVYGSDFYETPNIDRLAAKGMLFTNAYSNAPNCAPSRASLLTGQYTPRHGIYTVGSPARGEASLRKLIPAPNNTALGKDAITIADRLQEAGYQTAMIGKWHLGDEPRDHGFDMAFGGNRHGRPASYFCPFKDEEISVPFFSERCAAGDYLTDKITDHAVDFVASRREKPFFLYLSHYAVHTPIEANPAYIADYEEKEPGAVHGNADYATMVRSLDESVGRLMTALEQSGADKNTVVIFHSDNGGHSPTTSMTPLRGAKGMIYEGGIRTPMIIRWPGVTHGGATTAEPVMATDLFPTILEVAGIMSDGDALDGLSLVGLLQDSAEAFANRSLHWHFPAYLEAYPGGLSLDGIWRATPAGAIRRGSYKLIEWFESGDIELYDLSADVGEQTDLSQARPDLASALREEMRAWRSATGAIVPTEKNPDYVDPES